MSAISSSDDCEVAVVVERVDQRGDDLPVAQRQVEQRKLAHQVIAQRAGGDLLRREVLVARCELPPPQSPSVPPPP